MKEENGAIKDDDGVQGPGADENDPGKKSGAIINIAEDGLGPEEIQRITDDLIGAIKTIYDPEIPVDIYELGLIYKVDLDDERNLVIDMTLTAPGCPVAGEMPIWVENAARSVEGIQDVRVNMVFDPPWSPDRMSEEAQVALNWW